jgi:hypothetical protein
MTESHPLYDMPTITILRRALSDVLTDRRFYNHEPPASALEVAEHILAKAASGERDLDRLRDSAFAKLGIAA